MNEYTIKQATEALAEEFVKYRAIVAAEQLTMEHELRGASAVSLIAEHDKPNRRLFFAIKDNRIIGELSVSSVDEIGLGIITKIYVLKTERQNGVARALVKELETFAAKRKCKGMSVWRDSSTFELFTKLGYSKVPVKEVTGFLVKVFDSRLVRNSNIRRQKEHATT